ncbi:activating signal cointegrator 1 complex subunit 1 [Nomia melanderi]|uniref:activating signal cointegrator 1 complex subunit 1 n=1 Tax=Nomia melanderi TaxID=2448451 RepID=UPI00130443CA|nr:activating signal cointegrator 1 complex subunit 1 [Nomia melanderi]
MNVLKPDLIWVEDRCYRFLGKGDSNEYVSPYMEDNNLDIEDEEEFNDSDIEITPYQSRKYKHTFHVAKSFFPFIIGSKHSVRKRLEIETRTTIQIPKMGQDGDVVIIGCDRKGIVTARRRIDLLIAVTRKRQHSTHFLSIPLNEGHIIMKFNMFKNSVLTNLGKVSKGIDERIFQTPSKLHLTIGILKLFDDVEREQAIKALDYCKEHIIKPAIKKYGQIPICLQGIEIMNDDPTETRILYAKVIDANNALQEICDKMVNYYANIGLLEQERENVKLHVTLMNSKFKLIDKEDTGENETIKTFDVSDILKAHENTSFGETVLKQIHISQRHTISSNGYYQATAKLNLTENL